MARDDFDEEDDDDNRPRRSKNRYDEDFEPHRGVLILVLGILAFFVCPLTGIAAWIMGAADLRAMREGRMDPEGKSVTQIGMILGIIQTVLGLLGLLVWGAIVILAVVVAANGK